MKVLYIYRNDKAGPSIRRAFEPIQKKMCDKAEVKSIKLPFVRMFDILKNAKYVIGILKKEKFDIIHITGDVYYLLLPLSFLKKRYSYKLVTTVHDLGHYTQHKHSLMHFFYYYLWIKPLYKSDHVAFISSKSLKEGRDLVNLNPENCSVVYDSYDERYVYSQSPNHTKPIVLQIGTKPNKNFTNVILSLKDIPCHLRVVGPLNEYYISLLRDNQIDYSQVSNISDEDILKEYNHCDVVSFPSVYEGFGMPIIEGQAVGRVVVTSRVEPMTEIAGGASIIVDPHDVNDMKKGYIEAINNPNVYIKKGLENINRFSPLTLANKYYSLYTKLIKS